MANVAIQYSVSRGVSQRRRAKLKKQGLQPVTCWYLIYRMAQDRINIRIYLVPGNLKIISFDGHLMPTITKKELVDRITQRTHNKHVTVKTVVQQFLEEIATELAKNNRLEFRKFGVFEVREGAPRTAQNPKTLEPVEVPARRKVKFKMGRIMREKLDSKAVER